MKKGLIVASLEHRIRPMLLSVPGITPERFIQIYSRTRNWFLDMLATCNPEVEAPKHEVNVCGVKFRNDLGNAAGLDKDGKLLAFHYLLGAGFAVVGTVLSEPHQGNIIQAFGMPCNPWTPLPHTGAAINTLGLPSHGVDYVVENIRSFRDAFEPVDFPIGASVMGHPKHKDEKTKLEGIMYCLDRLFPYVDFIEVN